MADLKPGLVKIQSAEFIAALITCETFSEYCAKKLTTLLIDNVTARSWIEVARCPRHPFDRVAQAAHLFWLEKSIKIKPVWVSSSDNYIADIFSRGRFDAKIAGGHFVAGMWFTKIKPKWLNVVKFL